MSNISEQRLNSVVSYYGLYGREQTLENFQITSDTLSRYLRKGRSVEDEPESAPPRVLIFDIETAPTRAYVFKLWKENIPIDFVESAWFMLSWSAKWLFEGDVYSQVLTSDEAVQEDDKRIIDGLWRFIDEADFLVGHNIRKFDVPKMNTRYIKWGLKPPSPYQQIDTLFEAKKNFYLESNKLDYIARFLGVPGKLKHEGASMWVKCLKGDETALKTMDEYNRQDIVTTEDVYLKLRPWIKNHPNLGLYYSDQFTRCRACGSVDLNFNTGKSYGTSLNKYTAIQCNHCGHWSRARSSELDKVKNKSLLASAPR